MSAVKEVLGFTAAVAEGTAAAASAPKSCFTVLWETKTRGITLYYSYSWHSPVFALWNTNCLYKSMTFTIAHISNVNHNGTLDVYLDGQLTETYDLQWDGCAQTIMAPRNYAADLKPALHGHKADSEDAATAFAIYGVSFSE